MKSGGHEVVGYSFPDVDLADYESAVSIGPDLTPDAHLIVLAAVKRQFGDTLDIYRKNMLIAENICRLLEKRPVAQVIFFSSAAVYGEETENPSIDEGTLVNPTSYYGMAKYASERLFRKTCTSHDIRSFICVRPPLIYGPGDEERTYGPSGFCADALEDRQITLWGDGGELREFLYVEDAVGIIEMLLSSGYFGEVNLSSGSSRSFADIIAILRKHFPGLKVGSKPRTKSKADNAFSPRLVRSLLPAGFSFTPLEEGIARLLAVRREA